MEKINIGLLLPTSSILPISKDFEKGIKNGMTQSGFQVSFELVREFVGQGGVKQVEEATKKLFNYHDVDVITGVLSSRVAEEFAPTFQNKKTPLIVNDLGGHLPNVNKLNDHVFINSPHLWRHAWTMGYYGVKNFGLKGMFIGSVYDSGYGFSQMFSLGMEAANPDAKWSFSVTPMPPAGELSDMSVIFPFLEKYEPDFIFAAFCGAETTLFLNELIAKGWHKRTKVLGLPYLTVPFAPLNDSLSIYSTLAFTEHPAVNGADAYYQMGHQTGSIISQATQNASGPADLQHQIYKLNKLFNVETNYTDDDQLTIVRQDIEGGAQSIYTQIIGREKTFTIDSKSIAPVVPELSFGWVNPYLCI